ncbi:hypothetical protein BG004_007074 [Podila humilis]|nr:hypothetical protein BG004_007074 [Podila humilis]
MSATVDIDSTTGDNGVANVIGSKFACNDKNIDIERQGATEEKMKEEEVEQVYEFEYEDDDSLNDQYSDDDDDGVDWEEVDVSASISNPEQGEVEENDLEEPLSPNQYNTVEIVLDGPQIVAKRSANRGVTKDERIVRIIIHQSHLLCLIASTLRRNRWISHPKFSAVALSLVPTHIAGSVQTRYDNSVREMNSLNNLALWWRDSFVVTGPGIQKQEYVDIETAGIEAAMPKNKGERMEKRKSLQQRLVTKRGSSDVCAQLFTGICRSLGLRTRLIESLQACSLKISLRKEEDTDFDTMIALSSNNDKTTKAGSGRKGKRKKIEEEIEESDTTRGSREIFPTPHRLLKKPTATVLPKKKLADPPVFWTEVYSSVSSKWIPIDAVRGIVNQPLRMHPSNSCTSNVLSYVVAYDEDNYVTDVTRRYTSQWGSTTRKLRTQPASADGFDWWAQTMSLLRKPHLTQDEELEQAELLQSEISEKVPTKLGDFNNHPLYALERYIKKFEVLHPRIPILGHIRGEAIYPRSCVKQVRSKENWLKLARQLKPGELVPAKWVRSKPSTIYQMRLRHQTALSGTTLDNKKRKSIHYHHNMGYDDDAEDSESHGGPSSDTTVAGEGGSEHIPLFGEWQTEPYQPPFVVDGRVPRNAFGRQDVFTPAMIPIGGAHLKGRNIARVARLLGVDYVEAVTGFDFHSRRSIPVIQGIIVPAESAELVLDGYREISQHADEEARKKKKDQVLQRWRKLIKGAMVRARLLEEYGDHEDDMPNWVPEDDEK